MAEPDFDAQFTFDDLLRTELGPASVDFLETGFFRSREAWPNRPSLPTTAHVRDRVGGETAGTVSFPELGLFVKFGPPHRVRLEEAQALQAIRRAFPSDEVRSPELVGWRKEGDVSYIYMSLIPGPTLEACWPTLTFAERTNVTDQLAQMLASLRGVRQDRGIEYIGALDHGPVQARFFDQRSVGPFPDAKEFNDAVQRWALPKLALPQRPPDPFRQLLPDAAGICFTHGDLHLDNIIVSRTPGDDLRVSIVDWGQAGWYPEYWEWYHMAAFLYDHEFGQQGWFARVLTPHEQEYEALVNYWSWRGPA